MLRFIRERIGDYNANGFINELVEAAKNLGILEAKISSYQFNSILIPILHKKEAISSMYIEGTQTTISDVFENVVLPNPSNAKMMLEINNHTQALIHGSEYLRVDNFSVTAK